MDKTTKADQFRDVFQHSLKINARSLSVKTLLSDRNLRRINYSPYYQRNYVWDREKQTFFIESVILGTEVPPLILFKHGAKIEVIDGRQRFETLKKFIENDLTLSVKGLKELQILSKKSFNKLSEVNRRIFLESNIRVFEFEVIDNPNLSYEVIDKVKKEIFRRYNTGITPLTRSELDGAKYDDDVFSELFKDELKSDKEYLTIFNACFFPKETVVIVGSNDGVISKNVDQIRRFRILNRFPISTYAGSSNRTEIIDLLYDFSNNDTDNIRDEYSDVNKTIKKVLGIYKLLSCSNGLNNKFIYECMMWALSILDSEGVEYEPNIQDLKSYYSSNINVYTVEPTHHYRNIINRFQNTAAFFQSKTSFDFTPFIRDTEFANKVREMRQTEEDSVKSIEELSNLRLHKPNPTSIPVDEIKNDLKSSNYLLRPSYQRQEKITELKASAIIESMLLGINLPPIFIFKRSNLVKEVVDGQQRLLAIIGYLGNQYHNENGELTYSLNNSFKLKGLRVLTDLEGKRYNDLSEELQDKILDFVIDLIVIEEDVNESFDPIDLFIRLNYKPYPIKPNSFEMWNSIVDQDVILKVKDVAKSNNSDWFFLREIQEGKADRMQNEELIVSLSYIVYNAKKDDAIGFFPRKERITCRIKNKKALSDFLIDLDNTAVEKNDFLDSIDKTDFLINKLSSLFDTEINKEMFNEFLNVKGVKIYRRSLQDFYVIWLILMTISDNSFNTKKQLILDDIKTMLSLLKNVSDKLIDDEYLDNFNETLSNIQLKYK